MTSYAKSSATVIVMVGIKLCASAETPTDNRVVFVMFSLEGQWSEFRSVLGRKRNISCCIVIKHDPPGIIDPSVSESHLTESVSSRE